MRPHWVMVGMLSLAVAPAGAAAQAHQGLEIKYVRDGEEYATIVRQIYRGALREVLRRRDSLPRGTAWAVVLDVDETTLDNSAYQLERGAYGLPFENASWNAWVARREAGPVPGVVAFLHAVRAAGGRVAFVSGRDEVTRDDTRANLAHVGAYAEGDLLCLEDGSEYTKGVRRRELASGEGRCAWAGVRPMVVAFLGDALGDFPSAGEAFPEAGVDSAFGRRFFLLPNPMYGRWDRAVTRLRGPDRP